MNDKEFEEGMAKMPYEDFKDEFYGDMLHLHKNQKIRVATKMKDYMERLIRELGNE